MGKKQKRASTDKSLPNVSPTHSSYAVYSCALATLLIALLCGYYVTQLSVETHHTESVYRLRNVTRTRLSSSPHISYRELAERRVPMVLTNSIINKWRACKHFTTAFLAKKLSVVSVYSQHHQRSFITFHDNKPLEEFVVSEKWEDYNIKTNITIPQLLRWDDSDDSTGNIWRYYSQEITQLTSVFPDVLDYVQPLKPLVLDQESLQVNLWIGRAGIITHTHYDATYNFFVQLQGRKRFTLFPPNQTMYLYPCLHPHYGHSQVDILRPDLKAYPLFQSVSGVVAELGPGDMLVVPPFWFHHVETLEESVSVNVWSDAPEYTIMNDIYSLPIPFEDNWLHSELAMATCIYSIMIVQGVGIEESYRDFISDSLINQRYHPIVSSGRLLTNQSCYQNLLNKFSSTDPHEKMVYFIPLLEKGVANLKAKFDDFSEMPVVRICVSNYIEHLIHRVVGVDCVYEHLSACLTWTQKLTD